MTRSGHWKATTSDQAPPMADTWALTLGPKADAWRPFRA
jgi:hypothetical protein